MTRSVKCRIIHLLVAQLSILIEKHCPCRMGSAVELDICQLIGKWQDGMPVAHRLPGVARVFPGGSSHLLLFPYEALTLWIEFCRIFGSPPALLRPRDPTPRSGIDEMLRSLDGRCQPPRFRLKFLLQH